MRALQAWAHAHGYTPAAPVAVVEQLAPAPAEWERGLEPRTMDDARQLAKWMFESADVQLPTERRKRSVLSTVLLGRELGMPAMAALRSVHVIDGKHSLSADLMVALVLKSGKAEYFQTGRVDRLRYAPLRQSARAHPRAQRLSYTIEQATQAGLTRGNWQKIPKQMLRARAKSELARLEYPDLLAGLYTPEELDGVREVGGNTP